MIIGLSLKNDISPAEDLTMGSLCMSTGDHQTMVGMDIKPVKNKDLSINIGDILGNILGQIAVHN